MVRIFLSLGSLFGFLSVALGAFAAHALKRTLGEYEMDVFRTGVQYQCYHALALLAVGILSAVKGETGLLNAAGWLFAGGIVVFSGSLYLLALTGVRMWGAVTPIGGVGFLVGWALLFLQCWRQS